MNVVDIDKVLDDLELNEDRKSKSLTQSNDTNDKRNAQAHADVVGSDVAIQSPGGYIPVARHSNESTAAAVSSAGGASNRSNFVNVSNVFLSLNEYVNAGIEVSSLEKDVPTTESQSTQATAHQSNMDVSVPNDELNQTNIVRKHTKRTKHIDPLDAIEQDLSYSASSNDIADQYSHDSFQPLCESTEAVIVSYEENIREHIYESISSTSSSHSALTSNSTSTGSSLSQSTSNDCDDIIQHSNHIDLTNEQTKPISSMSLDETASLVNNMPIDNDMENTSSTSSPVPSIEMFSQTLSNVNTLPLRSTVTSDDLNTADSTQVIATTESQLTPNNPKLDELDADQLDRLDRNVLNEMCTTSADDHFVIETEDVPKANEEEDVEDQVPEDLHSDRFIKPLCFEAAATMDDVSDTELESYLQELEDLEEPATTCAQPDQPDENKVLTAPYFVEHGGQEDVADEQITLAIVRDDKNSDSFSQASTVEFAEFGAESDFDASSNSRHQPIDATNELSQSEAGNPDTGITTAGGDNDGGAPNDGTATSAMFGSLQQSSSHLRPSTLELSSSCTEPTSNFDAGSTPAVTVANESNGDGVEQSAQNTSAATDNQSLEHTADAVAPSNAAEATGTATGATAASLTSPHLVADNTANRARSATLPGYNLSINELGKVQPYWIPDNETTFCMRCNMKFSFIKRRHHCRACGHVLCSACCSLKAKLEYMGDVEARVCTQCDILLNNLSNGSTFNADGEQDGAATGIDIASVIGGGQAAASGSSHSGSQTPNPNNPMEYCSTIPPHQQVGVAESLNNPISVMVPVGVLKRDGVSLKPPRKDKNVMFSDGIRPGCDLTDLDNNWGESSGSDGGHNSLAKSGNRRVQTPPGPKSNFDHQLPKKGYKKAANKFKYPPLDEKTRSFIPATPAQTKDKKFDTSLPPILTSVSRTEFRYSEVDNNDQLFERLQNEQLKFIIQRNFYVLVKIIKLTCCINKTVINFTTQGMHLVGQDEIVILLEVDESNRLPKDIFVHLNEILLDAEKGHTITELGFSIANAANFLGSKEHSGFLYIRTTFQCMQSVHVPENPYLIGILIHRWEVPWAKIFPLRLMLRLGALHRYYPSPHVSVRGRNSVYAEIAQTIINFLADFRTYSYTIATISGMLIHMEDRRTNVLIPKNRYDQIMRALNNSSEHILALAGNFSKLADGHLVCVQNTESGCAETHAYSTQAINIQGKPRKVTGASFLVLNGALKTASGLSGKCSIVEDGLMVQILPKKMTAIQQALKTMKNIDIVCGPTDADASQTEVVSIQWVENDTQFNVGVVSCIDREPMDGIPSILIHRGVELMHSNHIIRWTEVFIIRSDEESAHGRDPIDMSKLSEHIANSACTALVSFLDLLAANGMLKLAIRATLDPDQVCYEAGSNYEKLAPLYMNALDNELVPTLHRQASNLQLEQCITIELVFHILNE